jgi:hypothetical protein
MKFNVLRLALLPAMLLACAATLQAAEVTVSSPDSPMLRFALGKLEAALQGQADTLKRTINQAPDQGAEIVVTGGPTSRTRMWLGAWPSNPRVNSCLARATAFIA